MKLISSSSLLLLSVILGLYNRVASHPPSYQRWNDKAFEAAENAEEAEEIAEEAEDLAEDAYLDSKYADEHSESKYVKMRAEEAEREYKQVIANENSAEEAAESARRNAEMGDTKDAIRYQKKAIDSAEKAVDNAGDALWNSVEAIDAARDEWREDDDDDGDDWRHRRNNDWDDDDDDRRRRFDNRW